MKCPLLCIGNYSAELMRENPSFECLREECAWFDENGDRCSVLELSRTMTAIGHVLGDARRLMNLPRAVFTCAYCGLRVELEPGNNLVKPPEWKYAERIDGKFSWLCDRCSTPGRS